MVRFVDSIKMSITEMTEFSARGRAQEISDKRVFTQRLYGCPADCAGVGTLQLNFIVMDRGIILSL